MSSPCNCCRGDFLTIAADLTLTTQHAAVAFNTTAASRTATLPSNANGQLEGQEFILVNLGDASPPNDVIVTPDDPAQTINGMTSFRWSNKFYGFTFRATDTGTWQVVSSHTVNVNEDGEVLLITLFAFFQVQAITSSSDAILTNAYCTVLVPGADYVMDVGALNPPTTAANTVQFLAIAVQEGNPFYIELQDETAEVSPTLFLKNKSRRLYEGDFLLLRGVAGIWWEVGNSVQHTQVYRTTRASLSAGDAIADASEIRNAALIEIDQSSAVTLTSTPHLAPGVEGQLLWLVNTNSGSNRTLTLQSDDVGGLPGSNFRTAVTNGTATESKRLHNGHAMLLRCDAAGVWWEVYTSGERNMQRLVVGGGGLSEEDIADGQLLTSYLSANNVSTAHTGTTTTGGTVADYVINGSIHRANPSSALTIQGLSPGAAEEAIGFIPTPVYFFNIHATNTITFKHEDGSAAAEDRIITVSGGDVVLSANEGALFIYDATSSRWRLLQKLVG